MRNLSFIFCLLLLSSCANPYASLKKMVYEPVNVGTYSKNLFLKNSIKIESIIDSRKKYSSNKSKIEDSGFSEILELSLQRAQLYNGISPKYALRLEIIDSKQPKFGLNFTAMIKTNLRLTEISTNKIIINEDIVASATANVSEKFNATERLVIVTERTIKLLMEKVIERLRSYKSQ